MCVYKKHLFFYFISNSCFIYLFRLDDLLYHTIDSAFFKGKLTQHVHNFLYAKILFNTKEHNGTHTVFIFIGGAKTVLIGNKLVSHLIFTFP